MHIGNEKKSYPCQVELSVEQVLKYQYLGHTITEEVKIMKEI